MATTTTNFGWDIPQSTDLVKDGATAIATLGQDIDTALVDLKGGTTGQVLSKASNSDLDFTWANAGDITEVTAGTGISGGGTSGAVTITNSMATAIDAKGDLIVGTGADTFSRLAVGATDGHVLQVASGESTGVKWAAVDAASMTLINTGGTTLSGASVTISSIPTTYQDLRLIIRGVRPATDGTDILMRWNGDTATRYVRINGFNSVGSQNFSTSWGSLKIVDDMDNGTDTGLVYVIIQDYANTTTWKSFWGYSAVSDATTPANLDFNFYAGTYNQTPAITSITLLPGSGNWTSGTAYLYGVK